MLPLPLAPACTLRAQLVAVYSVTLLVRSCWLGVSLLVRGYRLPVSLLVLLESSRKEDHL